MLIYKNTANTVVLTLTENQSQTTHDWLFEFTNQTSGVVKYCSAADTSLYTDRYNEFVITDSTTESALSGQLDFSPTGSWTYKIYEMPVYSPPSLNSALAYKIVEEGTAVVIDLNENDRNSFDADEDKNNGIFDV